MANWYEIDGWDVAGAIPSMGRKSQQAWRRLCRRLAPPCNKAPSLLGNGRS